MKNISLLCIALLLVVACFQQADANNLNITLTKPAADLVWTPPGPYQFHSVGDSVKVTNSTQDTVLIALKSGSGAILDSATFLRDSAQWFVLPGNVSTICCSAPPVAENCQDLAKAVPTLTQWGLISLLALILVSGVIVAIRKRSVTVQ